MLRFQVDVNPLLPAFRPDLAVKRPVSLPVGGTYRKGRVLGLVTTVTPVSEIDTLTITGTPTGFTGSITFATGAGNFTATLANLVTTVPTAAEMQAVFDTIFGAGNVTVSKSSLVYTLTFGGLLANTRIAYTNLTTSFTYTAGSSPAAAFATSTRGSAGAGQADTYDDTASDGTQVAKSVLIYDYLSDQLGGRVTDQGVAGAPFSPEVYITGFFRIADLLGLDAAGVTDLGRMVEGTAYNSTGGVLFIR